MKKLISCLLSLTLTLALSMNVVADPTLTGEELPAGSVEHFAWELLEGYWMPMGTGNVQANARAWSSNPVSGQCNKIYWEVPVTVHASVAQWIEYTLSGSRYDWRVRKPGTYAANSLTATLKSNSDVEIEFEGFENLRYQGSNQFPGVNQEIDTWYAYGEAADPGTVNFIPAEEMNGMDAFIQDSADLHAGFSWKLWNKIEVDQCNSACEYQDDATITLVLQNQKIWIDPETGYFAD